MWLLHYFIYVVPHCDLSLLPWAIGLAVGAGVTPGIAETARE